MYLLMKIEMKLKVDRSTALKNREISNCHPTEEDVCPSTDLKIHLELFPMGARFNDEK